MATKKVAPKKRTPRKKKTAVSEVCVLKGTDDFAKGCPGKTHELNPYRYQKGCRGLACRVANRDYYREWRAAKLKLATKRKPAKKVPAKKQLGKRKRTAKRS